MVSLRPITVSNWEEAARLEVHPDQAEYIESNLWSIAELQFYPELEARCIYDGRTMVGFLVWGFSPDDGRPWLYRFMIDRQHQRKGFGRAALGVLIKELKQRGAPELNVGYHRDNRIAEKLYMAAGFRPQGLAPWGELMARIDF